MLVLALATLIALSPAAPGFWPFGAGVALADDDGGDGGDDGGDDGDGDDGDGDNGGAPAARGRDAGDRPGQRAAGPARARQPAPRAETARADIVAAEIVALGLGSADIDVLVGRGYRVLDDRSLAALGGERALRLAVPEGRSLEGARDELRSLVPGVAADFHHLYRAEQAPGGPEPSCRGQACGPRSQVNWPFSPDTPVPGCDPGGVVGMIDTGVNDTHPALLGRVAVTRLDPGAQGASADRHGTAVAALLVGAPGSTTPGLLHKTRLLAVDVFHKAGNDERAGVFDLITGLDLLAAQGVRAVNLSLAGPPNMVLERVVDRLSRQGILLVAAVGNGGAQAGPAWPAAYPQVLAVTAVDAKDRIYRRAVQGPHVELAAPGVQVWTAAPGRAGQARNGTSFAAPFVTAAAHVLMGRGLSAREARLALAMAATDLGPPGPDQVFGHGLLHAGRICDISAG